MDARIGRLIVRLTGADRGLVALGGSVPHPVARLAMAAGHPVRTPEALAVPVLDAEDRPAGALCAIARGPRLWSSADEGALLDLAALVGERERLAADGHRDELTGLPNRRLWLGRAPVELARAARLGHPLSVVMLDLDEFKAVNDSLGHAAGDEVLEALGQTWAPLVRLPDGLVRWGGDEFAVLLPDADARAAAEVAERLCAAAEDLTAVSAGVAEWDRRETVGELLERADRDLLCVKRAR